ncbi:MAG: hypothetical protein GX424_06280 [Clostridiales bacterium]|jgi:tetratricopeptide (TPR) repeat protein|nr:hypothetical protein [Clostridiales bacterium]
MEEYRGTNDDLAAALFYLLGKSVPHRSSLEEEAQKIWDQCGGDKNKILHKIVELCGDAETPKQKYLVAEAYSWLGKDYDKQTIAAAGDYLRTAGWNEFFRRSVQEDGITVDTAAAQRASVLIDLARAQEDLGRLQAALFNYTEAYRLEPYRAMYVIKAAGVVEKMNGREEALQFLEAQKKSKYYEPVRYTDAQGSVRSNDLFQQLLDAQILKYREDNPDKTMPFHF